MVAPYFVVCNAFIFTLVAVCEKLTLTELVFERSSLFRASGRVHILALLLLFLLLFILLLVSLFALLFLLILLNLAVIIVRANFLFLIVLHTFDLVFVISLASRIKAASLTTLGCRILLNNEILFIIINTSIVVLLLFLVLCRLHCCF